MDPCGQRASSRKGRRGSTGYNVGLSINFNFNIIRFINPHEYILSEQLNWHSSAGGEIPSIRMIERNILYITFIGSFILARAVYVWRVLVLLFVLLLFLHS